MCRRYFKTWLWKVFGITLVLCIVPMVFLFGLSVSWKTNDMSLHNIATVKQLISIERNADFELVDKVVMRRSPYIMDSACKNFSVR